MAEVKKSNLISTRVRMPEERTEEEPLKVPEKMIEGTAKVKKKGILRKIKDKLFTGDGKTVMDWIIDDYIVPTSRDVISTGIQSVVDIFLFGQPSYYKSNMRSNKRLGAPTPYSSYSMNRARNLSQKASYGYVDDGIDFDDILMTKGDADFVLAEMRHRAAECGYVLLYEYYSLCKLPYDYTARDAGWNEDDLYYIHIKRSPRGYIDEYGNKLEWYIPLPRVRRIDA